VLICMAEPDTALLSLLENIEPRRKSKGQQCIPPTKPLKGIFTLKAKTSEASMRMREGRAGRLGKAKPSNFPSDKADKEVTKRIGGMR